MVGTTEMNVISGLSSRDKRTVALGVTLFLSLICDIFGKRVSNAIRHSCDGYPLVDLVADLSIMRQSLLRGKHVPMSELSAFGKTLYSHFRRKHDMAVLSEDPKEVRALNLVYSFLRKLNVSVKTDDLEDFKRRMINHEPNNVDEFYMSSVEDEMYYLLHEFEHGVQILPRHGPGTVAERTRSLVEKEQLMCTPQCIQYLHFRDDTDCYQERLYGDVRRYVAALATWGANPLGILHINLQDHSDYSQRYPVGKIVKHARVVAVPKDSKSQRIICAEPTVLQYYQQGLARALRTIVKKSPWGSQYRFDDQTPNQLDAKKGSIDNSLSTLDLKQASDSVDLRTITRALRRLPRLRRWVLLTRSTHFVFPDKSVVESKILSPMGSGTCFDFESIFFLAIARAAVRRCLGKCEHQVRVFGDDIIVPTPAAQVVINDLEIFGFTVNKEKSFIDGKFRESCGKEWYGGVDVTPIYFRVTDPSDAYPKDWSSFRALYNNLKLRGHCDASAILLRKCHVFPSTSFIWDDDEENTWFSFSGFTSPAKWDSDYQTRYAGYILPQVVTEQTDEIDPYYLDQWLVAAHLRHEDVVVDGVGYPNLATAKCRVGKCRYYIDK